MLPVRKYFQTFYTQASVPQKKKYQNNHLKKRAPADVQSKCFKNCILAEN